MEEKDYCADHQIPVEEKGEVLGPPLPPAGLRRRRMQRNVLRRIDDRDVEIKDDEEWDFDLLPHFIFFVVVAFVMYWLVLLNSTRSLPFIDRPYFPPPANRGGKSRRTSKPPLQEKVEETIENMFSDAETFNKILAAAIFVVPLSHQKEFKNFMSDLRHNPSKFKEWVSENPQILNEAFRAARRHLGEFLE